LKPVLALLLATLASPSVAQVVDDRPPPPPVFHPTPGPWLVGFKPNSAEYLDDDQPAVVHTAMRQWDRLEGYGFLLCYDGENRGTLPIDKLRKVATALYEAGAQSVINGSAMCYRLQPFPWNASEGVIILGVNAFRR